MGPTLLESSICNGLVWAAFGGLLECTYDSHYKGVFTVASFSAGMFAQLLEESIDSEFAEKTRSISPLFASLTSLSPLLTIGTLASGMKYSTSLVVSASVFSLATSFIKGIAAKPIYPRFFHLLQAASCDPLDHDKVE